MSCRSSVVVVLVVFAMVGGGVVRVGAAAPGTATVVNTELADAAVAAVVLDSGSVAFPVSEGSTDLNGDGDSSDFVVHVFDPATAAATNTGLATGSGVVAVGDRVAFWVSESFQGGTDLNGDGDTSDRVVHVFDPATASAANTGLASGSGVVAAGDQAAFRVPESDQGGTDLNGDGDTSDFVVHVFDPATATAANTGLAGLGAVVAAGDQAAFAVRESDQGGTDLNGDGDTSDIVVHVFDPATASAANTGLAGGGVVAVGDQAAFGVFESGQGGTDLNGDGDTNDTVVHVFDPATLTATNTGLVTNIEWVAVGDQVAVAVHEFQQGHTDLNGDGDTNDVVVHVFDPATATATNTGLADTSLALGVAVAAVGEGVAIGVFEFSQGGTDLNGDGDGDSSDRVVHVFHPATATTTNTGLATGGEVVAVGDQVAVEVLESDQGGADLNGDGDTIDRVVHVFDPATASAANTRLALDGDVVAVGDQAAFRVSESRQGGADLNGDGDIGDRVVHVFDPVDTATFNLGLAGTGGTIAANGNRAAFSVSETDQGADLNGDGHIGDDVPHVVTLNTAPRAVGDAATVAEGATLTVPDGPGDLLTNDIDREGDQLSAVNVTDPTHGTLSFNADGSFLYVHDGSEATTDSFTYWVSDGALESDPATVTITITPVNDAPVAVNDGPFTVDEAGTLTINGVLDNDTDAEGDLLSAVKVTDPTHGTFTLNPNGSFRYVHDGSETTTDSFTYRTSDGILESDPATVTITIAPVNDSPVAVNDGPFTVDEAGTLTVNGVLDNDTDAEGDLLRAVKVSDPAHGTLSFNADGSFHYIHDGSDTTSDSFTYAASDGTDDSNVATVAIAVRPVGPTVGLVDPTQGRWHLRNETGVVTAFTYGNPGDIPFMGDWDCDGDDTPGLFRQSDAFAYLRNANTVGIADIRFFFGNPSDIPLAGDWNGDGCDTLSIYRPDEQRFYIINRLGENEGGLGAADHFFTFGNPGDQPVVGDWDGDGIDEVGLHRESTGFFYWRNTLDTGVASGEIFFGDPGDRFIAGDWGTIDGSDTPAVFRPSNATFFFRHTLTQGVADNQFPFGETGWLPVAGEFGLD